MELSKNGVWGNEELNFGADITFITNEHGVTPRLQIKALDDRSVVAGVVEQFGFWLPSGEVLQSLPRMPPNLDDTAIISWLLEPDLANNPSVATSS